MVFILQPFLESIYSLEKRLEDIRLGTPFLRDGIWQPDEYISHQPPRHRRDGGQSIP
jgi:hypothetical protein